MASSSCFRLFPLLGVMIGVLAGCGNPTIDRMLGKGKKHRKDGPSPCDRADVVRIERPRYPGLSEDEKFTYAFQFIPPQSPDKPTVVYIPGGPGQTSIGDQDSWLKEIPAGYGLLLTDPRGVGCNFVGTDGLKTEFFRSESVARDVLAAVAKSGVTSFSLYGISYGTVVATMAGSLAERGEGPKPRSVVLEGVLGRTFQANESDDTYVALLKAKLDRLAQEKGQAKADLFRRTPLPLGFGDKEWLAALRTTLAVGAIADEAGEARDVTYILMQRAVSDDPAEVASAKKIMDSLLSGSGGFTNGSDTFYAYIACREIFPVLDDNGFKDGSFVSSGPNHCAEAGLGIDRRFDAKDWPIAAPIFYLEGGNDPATPVTLARHHFDQQTTSLARQFLLVEQAGHNPFGTTMSDCKDPVWGAMSGQGDFTAAVKGCRWKPGFKLSSIQEGKVAENIIAPGAASHALWGEDGEGRDAEIVIPALKAELFR